MKNKQKEDIDWDLINENTRKANELTKNKQEEYIDWDLINENTRKANELTKNINSKSPTNLRIRIFHRKRL